MLNAEDICFSYGPQEVLKKISFDAGKNEIISVLGPNGTGKTTLLKCICGMHKPDSGKVMMDGNDITTLSGKELARTAGYVPQTASRPRMTVFDSILIGRRPHFGFSAAAADIAATSTVIETMGLADLSLKYLDEISGGEFQKVQIARAIVQEPKVLILDEPTNNLDMQNQHRTMHMVEDAVRSRGMCTVMTMHDINLAMHYSDRYLFLNEGKVAAFGDTEIITEELIYEVYGIETEIVYHRDVPMVVPRNRRRTAHSRDHEHPHDIHDHIGHDACP